MILVKMTTIATYNYFLNSRTRDRGTINDWELILPYQVALQADNSYFTFQITSAQIPFSFAQINEYNSTTYYTMQRGSTGYNGSFTIPDGNYNSLTLISAWTTALTTSITAVSGYVPTWTTSYDIDSNTYSILLNSTSPATTITFLNNTGYTQINLCLGFSTSWTLTAGVAKTSDQGVNVSPSRCLYVQSDSLITTRSYEALTTPVKTSNILERIPINCTPNNYIIFQPPVPTISVLRNQVIDTIQLSLQDESLSNNLADMQLNWSLHIVINEILPPSIQKPVSQPTVDLASPQDTQAEIRRQQLLKEREIATQKLDKYKKKILKSLPTLKDNVEIKQKFLSEPIEPS